MDNFDFDKVKKRTNVDKDTIIELAKMVNENGLKDENTLRKVISKLSMYNQKHKDLCLLFKSIQHLGLYE